MLISKAGCIGNNGKNRLLSPGTSSQSEEYSSKWLIWLVCREPLHLICQVNIQLSTAIMFANMLSLRRMSRWHNMEWIREIDVSCMSHNTHIKHLATSWETLVDLTTITYTPKTHNVIPHQVFWGTWWCSLWWNTLASSRNDHHPVKGKYH